MTKQKSNRLKMNYLVALTAFMVTSMILFFNFQLNGQITSAPDVMPEYKSGEKALYYTFQQNILYPKAAREANTQGTVFISFTVNKKGEIEEIKAEDSKYNLLPEMVVVGYSGKNTPAEINKNLSILEKEGERVITLLNGFIPGQKNGDPISTRITLPITFKID